MARRNWTREELIVAFNLYCKIPFGKIYHSNPQLIELGKILGRSASAVSWKLVNFASLDPTITETGRVGAPHGSRLDKEIWEEFNGDWERLSYESERLLAQMAGQPLEQRAQISLADLPKEGKEREAVVKVRVNQSFFRATVLAAYDFRCCISGLAVPALLNASHIVPWAEDKTHRVNPRNGLCLNALLDRAFDRRLLTVLPDYTVQVSKALHHLKEDAGLKDAILCYEGASIRLPERFIPEPKLLHRHNQAFFRNESR